MTAKRCELTDLLVDACACPQHRGGQTVQEEADAERLALRARLLAGPLSTSRWFPAQFPGACRACAGPFGIGTAIRRIATAGGYVAECCAEEAAP